jgi:hypothetical protein
MSDSTGFGIAEQGALQHAQGTAACMTEIFLPASFYAKDSRLLQSHGSSVNID